MTNIAPKISVVMPVFNTERYLAAAVESVLSQTFRDFELIAVDDGSTDGSGEMLRRYAAADPRMRVISRPNTGIAGARNDGLSAARGDLIASMDSDDIAVPARLELQLAYMNSHPEVVCVGGAGHVIDEKGRYLTTLYVPLSHQDITQAALAGHTPIWGPCAMFRRKAAEQVGRFDVELSGCEDLDLWLKLGEIGELSNLSVPVVWYRLRTGSISHTAAEAVRGRMRRACENAWARRGICGRFEGTNPQRPGTDRKSQHQFMVQWGWWAFNSSQRRTAIIYGAKAVVARPLNKDGWRLLACAALKRPTGNNRCP
jgi:glycosyltransferase involved in cell wall biosynthesis